MTTMRETVDNMIRLTSSIRKAQDGLGPRHREKMIELTNRLFEVSDIPPALLDPVLAYITVAGLAQLSTPETDEDLFEHDVKIYVLGLLVGYELTRRG